MGVYYVCAYRKLVLLKPYVMVHKTMQWAYGKPGIPEQPGSAETDKFLQM